ncbi:MAG: GNAT family N-acetyltransferase [Erysipelotrichaceae bacterium]|nr:GNAT family N-acetyltransferase [Erysipelotrichaceae bacterium]
MRYKKIIKLKDGRKCCLRNAEEEDGQAVLDDFILTHQQTDNLASYVDEITLTVEQEKAFLKNKADSTNELELIALIGDKVVGLAGVVSVGDRYKVRHRASFGISIERDYWGLGIGSAMLKACIECAKEAGYEQLELEVIEGNDIAMAMYRNAGFVEYGRNPRGLKSRTSGYQEMIYMRVEL